MDRRDFLVGSPGAAILASRSAESWAQTRAPSSSSSVWDRGPLSRGNLPTSVRNRLLRRGPSFQPDAAIANGDHVYWDLHAPRTPREGRNTTRLDSFNRSALVFGSI